MRGPATTGTTIGLFIKKLIMKPAAKKIESPAWQNPAPGNEQNDSVKGPTNETIKTGGNSRSAEDDLDLEKHPYHRDGTKKEPSSSVENSLNEDPAEKDDPGEEPGGQSFKK
jgi:hypothetical protein